MEKRHLERAQGIAEAVEQFGESERRMEARAIYGLTIYMAVSENMALGPTVGSGQNC